MKVALILPPCKEKEIFGRLTGSNPILPPLDIASVASYLELQGHCVKIYDCPASNINMERLENMLEDFQPQLIGMTVDMPTLSSPLLCRAYEVAKRSKIINPAVKIVLYGFYPSRFPAKVLKEKTIDFAIIGEGELTVAELCQALQEKRGYENIDGLAYKEDGEVFINQNRDFIENLDLLPFPAYHLLPMERYRLSPTCRKKPRQMSIYSSRGCPSNCYLCISPLFWRRQWRGHSPDYILRNMDYIYKKYNITDFQFRDDIFTLNRERVVDFCSLLIKAKRGYRWSCYATFNTIDSDLIRLMKAAGCYQLDLGVETGSEQILKEYKGFNKDLVRQMMSAIKEIGMGTRLFFIIGPPSQTPQHIKETIDFAVELDPDYVIFALSAPYPGTAFYDRLSQKGHRLPEFEHNLFIENKALCDLPGFSRKYLDRMTITAFRKFYLRPKYILKRVLSIRSFYDIWSGLAGLLPLLHFIGKNDE